MGWFDWLTGGPKSPQPWRWGTPTPAEGIHLAFGLLEQVAASAGVDAPQVFRDESENRAELRGTLRGLPLRVAVDFSGDVDELELRYSGELSFMDLERDPNDARGPQTALPEAWDASDRVVFLARGISTSGSDAAKEAAAFRALPGPLQQRILAELERLDVRYFRSRPAEHSVMFHGGAAERERPAEWLADALALSVEVALARGATPPRPVTSDDSPTAAGDDDDERARSEAAAFAARLAARLSDAKVVERAERGAIDVRFREAGVDVRVVLDYRFDDLEVHARAPEVVGGFSLHVDAEAEVPRPDESDPWGDTDRLLFLRGKVFLVGAEAAVRAEAAVLRALPPELLGELLSAAEQWDNGPDLDEGALTMVLSELSDVSDDGAEALRLAQLLARVAAALPRQPVSPASDAVSCRSCGAMYFPRALGAFAGAAASPCPHCGATG